MLMLLLFCLLMKGKRHAAFKCYCQWNCLFLCVCVPLGDSRAGGPSNNVGGDRKALVSDADRPRGDGPYGDLSAGGQGQFHECKVSVS